MVDGSEGDQIKHRSAAVVTMSRDEHLMFPIFLRYYARHFEPNEIFVLDILVWPGLESRPYSPDGWRGPRRGASC